MAMLLASILEQQIHVVTGSTFTYTLLHLLVLLRFPRCVFFPFFTCDIILISTDHFLLLLSSMVSLSRIYTRVLFCLSGQSVECVCMCIPPNKDHHGHSP